MAITTSSSINVKPWRAAFRVFIGPRFWPNGGAHSSAVCASVSRRLGTGNVDCRAGRHHARGQSLAAPLNFGTGGRASPRVPIILSRKRQRRPLVFDEILPDVAGGFF